MLLELIDGGLRNCKRSRCSSLKNLEMCSTSLRRHGTWPVPLTHGLIALIPKAEGSARQEPRPISLHGVSVPALGLGPRDVLRTCGWIWRRLWNLHWLISDLMGMSTDGSKCHDRVPQRIAFKLAERQGKKQLPRGMYRSLRRRFLMTGHVGKTVFCHELQFFAQTPGLT